MKKNDSLFSVYKIENKIVDIDQRDRFDQLILIELKKYYSSGQGIRFMSSIDGFRTIDNTQEYYNACYNLGEGNYKLRTKTNGIISSLHNQLGDDHYYLVGDYIEKLKKISPKEFGKLVIRPNGQAKIERGKREKTKSVSFYNQGQGEIDYFEYHWMFDPLSFSAKNNLCRIYIIDEPENHKHVSLQRKILNRIIELSEERQFFICTHSPIFASGYKNSKVGVYLVTRDEDADTNKAKRINAASSGKEIKKELGMLNVDNFFSNAVLFVEGETESEVVPSIFRYYDTSIDSLGLKICNVGGNDKINIDRLKETLEILRDTGIKPFIILDRENNAEKNREDILRVCTDLFTNEDFQYYLWKKDFINSLPENIVLDAFNKLLKDKSCEKEFKPEDLKQIKESGGSLENELIKLHYDTLKSQLSKVTIGRYIANEIESSPKQDIEKYDKNEVFKYIKEIINLIKNIELTVGKRIEN